MTLVCVPLVAEMAAARARGADLVEIRLDDLAVFHPRRDLQLLLKNRPLPALVTYRPKWEGGEYEGDDSLRFKVLCLAMELGAEYIDIELKVAGDFVRFISGKRPENFKLIVSSHNYQSTPSRDVLGSLVVRVQAVGADIVKIATTASDIVDVTHMFQVIVHCQLLDTFLGLDSCTIPQQVDPIAKSIGAVNTIIKRPTDGKLVGYNTDYIGAISAIEDGIRGSQGKGASISPLAGKTFVVIGAGGAGGAGKALAYGARENGAKVVIANRTYERARELANLVGGCALTLAELEIFHPEDGMILANTTSIGMQPNIDETPLSKQALGLYAVVFDAVDTPKVIRLLREAEEAGASVVSGMEMSVRQAMGQFESFTGLAAPENLMRDMVTRTSTRTATVLSKI
ncbi:Bifunctional 3-dehydroquinate dehydratase shikimate [Musa troglodytarum]|uniref:Bifunctional 3-dehydroquinate dehydratase shikimate n=1 Tax=Musa troglodytarum TaxID=320322 RepID=A0A9E7KDA4_9LILI|nr:Bifunctional 3-dehydroquinate dehydratase shikimate [Musa troglodytarum]